MAERKEREGPPVNLRPSREELLKNVVDETPVDISKKTVLLRLTLRALGVRRTLSKALVQVDADKKLIHVGKDILDSPLLRKIRAHDGETRAYLDAKAFPSQFKKGVYQLSTAMVNDIDAVLQRRKAERAVLVDEFCDEYPEVSRVSRERLRAAGNDADYPPVEVVRGLFGFSYNYFVADVPDALRNVSRAIFEREAENALDWRKSMEQEVKSGLVALMKGALDHLKDRLANQTADGRVKNLRESAVKGLTDFLNEFPKQNAAVNFSELETLVERTRGLLDGVDKDTLVNNYGVREVVEKGLGDIKEQLDKLIVEQPVRQIVFDDDDE